jgi:hypothetical protein
VSLIRVLRTASMMLARTLYVDETPTDAFLLPGQSQLDHLDVSWTATIGGSAVILSDRVEVVGGFLFGLAEARASDPSLSDPVRYPVATLAARRIQVEQECERLCGWAFVPRFARAVLDGSGGFTLRLPHLRLRSLRALSTRIQPGGSTTVVSPLTDVAVSVDGTVTRMDGGYFPAGVNNIVAEYEHGADAPSETLKDAAMIRLRSRLNLTRSGVPDRVNSYTTPDGSVYRVNVPTRGTTGIPEVDAVYQDHQAPPLGFA